MQAEVAEFCEVQSDDKFVSVRLLRFCEFCVSEKTVSALEKQIHRGVSLSFLHL